MKIANNDKAPIIPEIIKCIIVCFELMLDGSLNLKECEIIGIINGSVKILTNRSIFVENEISRIFNNK